MLTKVVLRWHWVVLDELNFAPFGMLVPLHCLLVNNRVPFILEIEETISAHKEFMHFAMQNTFAAYSEC